MSHNNYLMLIVVGFISTKIASAQAPSVRPADKNWKNWSPSPKDTNPLNLNSPFSSGSWGANRRVFTNTAIGGATGTFQYGSMFIYKDPDKNYPVAFTSDYALPGESLADFKVRRAKYHRNKPTFYLGAKGAGVTSDSGYQWEEFGDNSAGIPPKHWGLFISVNSSVWSPQAANGANWVTSAWREVDAGPLSSAPTTLKSLILPKGELLITMKTGATFNSLDPIQPYWKRTFADGSDGNSKLLPDADGTVKKGSVDVSKIRFRRVVGITQGQSALGYWPDGSYFQDILFSGGQVINVRQVNGNFVFYSNTPTEWNAWTGPDPNNNNVSSASGLLPAYEPNPNQGGVNNKSTGKPWKYQLPWSKWPIDFGEPYTLDDTKGTPSRATQDAAGITRFQKEKVHINLFPIAKFKGNLAKHK